MEPLKLYNTYSRNLEVFKPINPPTVGLYTCGPTVYSTAHIGNLRTYLFEDVLRRTLELNGYSVKHVMNVTDVGHLTSDADTGEDKMEKAAKHEQRSAFEIAREYEAQFFNDLRALHIEQPTTILRATETIAWQIDLIATLESKGVTYRIDDGIYFDTSRFSRYGDLSGQKLSDKKAGARVEVVPGKKNPTDFALWKFSQPEDKRQMEWPSPWGIGFPGWHIECSAMSMHELGPHFDIHCGGVDHIAVHHENEIAQSETATSVHPWVNVWMHGEFLKTDKRMGKSEGNAVTLSTLQEHGINPLAFRYLCLQTHYRKPLSFTWDALEAAQNRLTHISYYLSERKHNQSARQQTPKHKKDIEMYRKIFHTSVNDDLNVPRSLSLFDSMRGNIPFEDELALLEEFDQVWGLGIEKLIIGIFQPNDNQRLLLERYEAARRSQQYATSDEIRKQFDAMGLSVKDLPNGKSELSKK